mgnify:CR=1 FL=1
MHSDLPEFVWPSDQSRADDPELDRVCEHLEAVHHHCEALAARLARLEAATRAMNQGIGVTSEVRAALAASPQESQSYLEGTLRQAATALAWVAEFPYAGGRAFRDVEPVKGALENAAPFIQSDRT